MRACRAAIWTLASIIICGCASQASLVVHSQPMGAQVSEVGTGQVFGIAPVRVVYNAQALSRHRNSSGCYIVKGMQARWISGATAVLDPISLCEGSTGSYTITLNRDTSTPGFDQDMKFSLQVQAVRAQQQQAQAAQDAAASQAFINAMRMMQAPQAAPPPQVQPPFVNPLSPTINCTSYQSGNYVNTRCQ